VVLWFSSDASSCAGNWSRKFKGHIVLCMLDTCLLPPVCQPDPNLSLAVTAIFWYVKIWVNKCVCVWGVSHDLSCATQKLILTSRRENPRPARDASRNAAVEVGRRNNRRNYRKTKVRGSGLGMFKFVSKRSQPRG
jgi:hypothetical protein